MKKYENLSKALYDIEKLVFATLILGQFISNKFNPITIIIGVILTASTFIVAFKLEQIEEI